MGKQSPQKWVVLLDKYPRGPFTEDEVQQLIEQGHLRRNDLALLVPENPQAKSDWKFLWQYPQFDIRQKEKTKAPPVAVLEKRTPRSDSDIREQAEEITPVDLRSIQIEDLIVRVNNAPKREFTLESRPEKNTDENSNQGSALASKTASGIFVVLSLIGMGWFGVQEFKKIQTGSNKNVIQDPAGKETASVPSATPQSRAAAAPRKRDGRVVDVPVPPANPAGDRKVSAEPVPVARDRGEIREEEILRAREEERRRELDERERRAREEEEERRRTEEDDQPSRSKSKKARRIPSEENSENENDEEPSLQNTVEPPEESVMED